MAAVDGVGELLDVIFSGPDPRPVHAVVRERLAYAAFEGDAPYEQATATRVVYGEPIDPAILDGEPDA